MFRGIQGWHSQMFASFAKESERYQFKKTQNKLSPSRKADPAHGATLGHAALAFPAIHGGAAGPGRPEGDKLDGFRKEMWWFVLERTILSAGLKAGSTFSWEQPLPTCASPASFEMQPLLGWAAVITLKHIVLPPLLAGRKEEYCAPSPDKIEINNWVFSQRADLSSLPLNLSWMGALYPFCFPGASVSFCSSQPMFMGRFKAANSSQEFFLALCFPSAVCLPLHTTDSDGSPSTVSKKTRCTSRGAGKLCRSQECSSREALPLLNQHSQELCHIGSALFLSLPYQPLQISSHWNCGCITCIHLLVFIHPSAAKHLISNYCPWPIWVSTFQNTLVVSFYPPGDDYFPRKLAFSLFI